MNSSLNNIPDISFIDNMTIDELLDQMVKDYQEKYAELTGENRALAQADPFRVILYTCAMQIYQAMQYADRAGKQNFLKYSYGSFLDNLATLRGLTRLPATSAVTILRFAISDPLQSALSVPAGARVTNGTVYFATDEYAEIPAGQLFVDVKATCTETGTQGNGFRPGEINSLVEPIAYISVAQNTTETAGGSEIESDDALVDRIYLASSAFSVAGPADAYIYWTKTVSADIADVKVSSPAACEVDVRFILRNGELPGQALIDKVQSVLENDNIRPLTDQVSVSAPETVSYDIAITYYIGSDDRAAATAIQDRVALAVENYKVWQSAKIGRDINPSYLISQVMQAGAKRVVVINPSFTTVSDTQIAQAGTVSATYGGIEND